MIFRATYYFEKDFGESLLGLVRQTIRHCRIEVGKSAGVQAGILPGCIIPQGVRVFVEREPQKMLDKDLMRPKAREHFVCQAWCYSGGASPLRAVMTGTARLGKGVRREAESEGSRRP